MRTSSSKTAPLLELGTASSGLMPASISCDSSGVSIDSTNGHGSWTIASRPSSAARVKRWAGWPWLLLILSAALILTGATTNVFGQAPTGPVGVTSPAAASGLDGVLALPPGPTLDEAPIAWATWLYGAAKTGEWRLVLAIVLIGLVSFLRWGMARFKRDLEELVWYREYFLPWAPVLASIAVFMSTDLLAGKSVGQSFFRAVGIGAASGGLYKALAKPVGDLGTWAIGKLKRAPAGPAPAPATPPAPSAPEAPAAPSGPRGPTA